MRFAIRYTGINGALLTLMGLGPRRSSVDVEDGTVRVRMGWGFDGSFPVQSVVGTGRRKRVFSWGAKGWRGWWIVNGSGRDLLILHLDPPGQAKVLGVRVKVRQLEISLEDEKGFLRAIGR